MTKPMFSSFDAADYLKSNEAAEAYLEAVLEEEGDDPAAIARALGVIARSQNMSKLAKEVGMTRVGLTKALSADGNPSFANIVRVARALGLQVSFQSTPRNLRVTN